MSTRIITESTPVMGIAPVDGWVLHTFEEDDSDGFSTPGYFARGTDRDVALDVSRFWFTPSQERFAFFVKAGFPPRPSLGPWDDTEIENAIAVLTTFRCNCEEATKVAREARAQLAHSFGAQLRSAREARP